MDAFKTGQVRFYPGVRDTDIQVLSMVGARAVPHKIFIIDKTLSRRSTDHVAVLGAQAQECRWLPSVQSPLLFRTRSWHGAKPSTTLTSLVSMRSTSSTTMAGARARVHAWAMRQTAATLRVPCR